MSLSPSRTKKARCSGSHGLRARPRLAIWLAGEAVEAVPNDHLCANRLRSQQDRHSLRHWIYHIWQGPMGTSANSMMLGAALAEAMTAVETTKEKWCEAENHSHRR